MKETNDELTLDSFGTDPIKRVEKALDELRKVKAS